MIGYYNMPEQTARAVDPDGWLHTGDLALREPNGCYRITGRLKEIIIRGGENIAPREVEEVLYRHPKIEDVQVVGVPSRTFGEEVLACVKLRAGAVATEDEIRDLLPRRAGPLQGPPARPIRRRLPDDRDRQDPEVQAPRAGRPRPRPRGRRHDRDGLTGNHREATAMQIDGRTFLIAGGSSGLGAATCATARGARGEGR